MRYPALCTLLLLLAGCAGLGEPRDQRGTLADLTSVTAPGEYAEVFLEELGLRLDSAGVALAERQRNALDPIVREHAEAHYAIGVAYQDRGAAGRPEREREVDALWARTSGDVEAVLTAAQVPVYRRLRDRWTAYFRASLRD